MYLIRDEKKNWIKTETEGEIESERQADLIFPLSPDNLTELSLEWLPPGKGAGTATGFGLIVTNACDATIRKLNIFTILAI